MDGSGSEVRASHVLIKHQESRNPVSRRTDRSTSQVTKKMAEAELRRWRQELNKDDGRHLSEKFAALAHHRSDCGSFGSGGDLGVFGKGEVMARANHTHGPRAHTRSSTILPRPTHTSQMQEPFEVATYALRVGELSGLVSTESGLHLIYRTA